MKYLKSYIFVLSTLVLLACTNSTLKSKEIKINMHSKASTVTVEAHFTPSAAHKNKYQWCRINFFVFENGVYRKLANASISEVKDSVDIIKRDMVNNSLKMKTIVSFYHEAANAETGTPLEVIETEATYTEK